MECKMIVCTLPIDGDRVLLVKYRDMPDHQRGWFVPHVLLNDRENPEDAAKRVLADQFGIAAAKVVFNHFESFIGRDGSWHLVFHFKTSAKKSDRSNPAKNLAASEWFAKNKLPPTPEIAHHGWAADIVEKCLANES